MRGQASGGLWRADSNSQSIEFVSQATARALPTRPFGAEVVACRQRRQRPFSTDSKGCLQNCHKLRPSGKAKSGLNWMALRARCTCSAVANSKIEVSLLQLLYVRPTAQEQLQRRCKRPVVRCLGRQVGDSF